MKTLWLWYFPLIFLPNFGIGTRATAFGTFEISDFLVMPYLVLVFAASQARVVRRGSRQAIHFLMPLLFCFLGWALLSTLTINLRYNYPSDYYIRFGLLKLAKLSLYVMAGIFTAHALRDDELRQKFDWSLLGAAVIVGVSLFWWRAQPRSLSLDGVMAYKGQNSMSAMLSVLLSYLIVRYFYLAPVRWKKFARFGYVIIIIGFLVSYGRGGWVAALCAMMYLSFRKFRPRTVLKIVGVGSLLIMFAYARLPEFRSEVQRTLGAGEYAHVLQDNVVLSNVDEGARVGIWLKEARKFQYAPLMGTGFFHRGRESLLLPQGSHSFWIQMFLETGICGGVLALIIMRRMWQHARYFEKMGAHVAVPVQAALVATFVAGMSGEYFYGGLGIFSLFAVYAQIGSQIPIVKPSASVAKKASIAPQKYRRNHIVKQREDT